MIQEHRWNEIVGRTLRNAISNKGRDVRRRHQMHDPEQQKQQPAPSKQSNASRCGHFFYFLISTFYFPTNRWLHRLVRLLLLSATGLSETSWPKAPDRPLKARLTPRRVRAQTQCLRVHWL